MHYICRLTIYINIFIYNIDILQVHTLAHTPNAHSSLSSWAFISPTLIMSSLFPSCHPWAAAEWQRSSTNEGSLIKVPATPIIVPFCYQGNQQRRRTKTYLSFVSCAWSLNTHANQCQSMPAWIGRVIFHNRGPFSQVTTFCIGSQGGKIEAVKHFHENLCW